MCIETPLVRVDVGLKCNLYMKREDLLPFSFGGNKVRIARELYSDMDVKRKNCMIGYGNARSNLCRVLANMNYLRGGMCHIISPSDDDGLAIETLNSKIVKSCGSIVHTCKKNEVSDTVRRVMNECEEKGFAPYYMYGNEYGKGNEEVLVRAYVKVYNEIIRQAKKEGILFDVIFLATGTGMTQAGLIAGKQMSGGNERIVGISVAREKEREIQIIRDYLCFYYYSIRKEFLDDSIEVVDDYLAGGYGKYNTEIVQTIRWGLRKLGIYFDPIYTGKAFWGMMKMIEKQKVDGNVLFIHTGGLPLFFDNIDIIF